MSFIKFSLLVTLMMAIACNNAQYSPPESALDAGSQFINAIFKGDFKYAHKLILADEANKKFLKKLEDDYFNRSNDDKEHLRHSSIHVKSVDNISNDTTIINFTNSYDNKPTIIKIIKQNNSWKIDLKYTFSGNF